MNLCSKRFTIGVALMLSIAMLAIGQNDCELKKENKDLKVYTCSSGDSKLKALKSEFVLEGTSLKKLLDFVNDVNNYVNWQYNTKEATILHTSDNSIIYRTVIEAPWPLSNREMIIEICSELDSLRQVLTIDTHHVAYEYPEDKDLVRVPFSVGIWHVSSLKNSLKVEFSLHIDPGGSVPAWLVNIGMAEGPYYTFTKLKEALKQRRH